MFDNYLKRQQKVLINNLFKEHYSFLFRIAYIILENKFDAEDAVSESFFLISKNIGRISHLNSPEILPYCITIVKNSAYKMRKAQSKMLYLDSFDMFVGKDESPMNVDIIVEKIFEKEDLTLLLKTLSDKEYELLELRVLDKLKFSQIAYIMGISEEAAKKRYQRLIEKLQKSIGGA